MMRPVKLAGDQLIWGEGSLSHLETLKGKKAVVVTGGSSMEKSGVLDQVRAHLAKAEIESAVFAGVEPDPHLSTCKRGAEFMLREQPDWIIALGGGSAMDAAKTMWILYEHPEVTTLADILAPNKVPKLRGKARMVAIPSTSGSASEVSRSICITDDETGHKVGVGDFEMMPDVAILDPVVTATMPPSVTAETGMDALTHAVEALASNRAHFLSDLLDMAAVKDICEYLPLAYRDGANLTYREKMHNASMIAGLGFTNVSLGIVHSMAQTLGGYFKISHGVADAVLLPYVIEFNAQNETAKAVYVRIAVELGVPDFAQKVRELNRELNIPNDVKSVIGDEESFLALVPELAQVALADGCTKTNPIIPTLEQLETLFRTSYYGG